MEEEREGQRGGQRPVPGDRSGKRWKGKREGGRERKEKDMGGGQGPIKRDRSECTQEVLPVAAAEDPRGRPVQMPEH